VTLLVFALVWLGLTLVLTAVLWVGTFFLQGLFYTEPGGQLHWRSPAAAAAVALVVTLWAYLAYVNPEEGVTASGRVGPKYDTLFRFSPKQRKEFAEFWVVRGEDTPDHRTAFKQYRDSQGHVVYYDKDHKRPPEHVDEIIVQENEQDVHFRAERETQGPNKGKLLVRKGQALRYLDDHGRVMTDDDPGHIYTVRWGRLIMSLVLNILHFAVWFVALWLLLRFQWAHALGLAAALWLVMTLAVLPMILDAAADRGAQKRAPPVTAEVLRRYRMCMISPSWTT
jgi:hypothetical protein